MARINARDTLHHSTGLEQAQAILSEGVLRPKAWQEAMGWESASDSSTPSIAASKVGFDRAVLSFSRAQRVPDPVTFEVDPDFVKGPRPVQGLPGMKGTTGKFEFETATQDPVDIKGVKAVLINRPRSIAAYGAEQAEQMIARIRQLAQQRNIPVIEGSAQDLLKRRVTSPGSPGQPGQPGQYPGPLNPPNPPPKTLK
jgi:hypothetical protein